MAYVNFSEAAPAIPAAARPIARTSARTTSRSLTGSFSPLEWLVIGLARKDKPSSLAEPGRLTRALRSLFGLGAISRLSDDRLEQLRRLAVLAWQPAAHLPTDEVSAFLAEYSREQLDALLATTGKSLVTRSAA